MLSESTVHRIPARGSLIYPCCGRGMFEVPRTDRSAWADEQVTCPSNDESAPPADPKV